MFRSFNSYATKLQDKLYTSIGCIRLKKVKVNIHEDEGKYHIYFDNQRGEHFNKEIDKGMYKALMEMETLGDNNGRR